MLCVFSVDQQHTLELDLLEESGTSQDEAFLPPPTHLLRSDVGSSPAAVPSRKHILPVECLICKRTQYIKERSSGKRRVEHLVRCETKMGGQLVRAAILRKDERVLLHVQDKDLVAVEVRYHKSCYSSYTKIVRKSVDLGGGVQLYDESYVICTCRCKALFVNAMLLYIYPILWVLSFYQLFFFTLEVKRKYFLGVILITCI